MFTIIKVVPLFVLLSGFAASALFAQNAQITGEVTDLTGGVVPGASVTVTNEDTGIHWNATTNAAGYFTVQLLQPGTYDVTVNKEGFKPITRTAINLAVEQVLRLNFRLELGQVVERVEIVGTPPPVATSSSSISHVVDSQRIDQLPLNGRNALQLIALVPGVVLTGTGGQWAATQVTFSVSGGRSIDMNFTLDGGFNMNTWYDIANNYPNPDALQEFSINTRTYSATLGRGSSSVIAVTKSGTNRFHGTVFEFLRNNQLDARPFFGATTPVFKRNQYGGTLGGPVLRNKLFFFFGYQGTKARGTPGVISYPTITAPQRAGNFSATANPIKDPTTNLPFPGNIIPLSRIRPFASKFLRDFLPPANSGPTLYVFENKTDLDQNQIITRVDYSIREKDKVYARYLYDNVPQRGCAVGCVIAADWISNLPANSYGGKLGYTRIFSPSLLNDFGVDYIHNAFGVLQIKQFAMADLGLPINRSNSFSNFGLTPQSVLNISGFFNTNMGAPNRINVATTHVVDTLSWIKGKHIFNFGFEAYRNRNNDLSNFNSGGNMAFSGQVTGNAAVDFLLGKFSTYRQITAFTTRLRQTLPSFFLQDDMHATSSLTVSLGLRYDPFRGYVSEDSQLSVFLPGNQSTVFPNAPAGLLFVGDDDLPASIIGSRWKNFAPRLGVAWDVRGNGRTSIRAGAGIYYVPLTIANASVNTFSNNQPWTLDLTVNGGDAENIFAGPPYNGVDPFANRPNPADLNALRRVPFPAGGNNTSFGLPFKTQTSTQWSLSFQQAIGGNSVLEVDYIGSSGSHTTTSVQTNPAIYIPGQSSLGNQQQRRLYPLLGGVGSIVDGFNSNYNSLQASFTKRYEKGFSIRSSYTLSKALGVVGDANRSPRDPFNYRSDYGPLNFDVRQNFVTSFIWSIPGKVVTWPLVDALVGGWQVSGIIAIQGGFPFTVVSGRDNSFSGVGLDTADQIGDWHLPGGRSKQQQTQQWFNSHAFVQNAVGTFGNVGINSLQGPGNWNTDVAVLKNVPIREGKRVEFRGSFYNLFNHANLGSPNATQSSPIFGQITSTSNPRVIEFGLKVAF